MPARAIGLAVRYSELLVAEQLGNTTFGTARHITTTLMSVIDLQILLCLSPTSKLVTLVKHRLHKNFWPSCLVV